MLMVVRWNNHRQACDHERGSQVVGIIRVDFLKADQ